MRPPLSRSFTYALEPARSHREWKFSEAQLRLAALQREFNEYVALREELEAECKVGAARTSQSWASKRDPAAQARMLGYLATVRQRQVANEEAIAQLEQRITLARKECVERQQRVEVLDQHRAEAFRDFSLDAERKFAAQADQEWSARSFCVRGGTP